MARNKPRLVNEEVPRAEPFGEQGRSGLNRFSGFIRDEWHPDLRGRLAIEKYREIRDNHPIVGAVLLAMNLLVKQTPKAVDKTADSPEHLKARRLCETALQDVEGGEGAIFENALEMLPYGFSMLEKVFKVSRGRSKNPIFNSKFNDGAIRWRKLAPRSPESNWRWIFDEVGDWTAWEQRAAPDHLARRIPRGKLAHFRLSGGGKDNPEGASILRSAYTSYFFQTNIQFVEALGFERNVAGIPHIGLPPELIADQSPDAKALVAKYKRMGEKLRLDEFASVVMPAEEDRKGKTGYSFGLVASSGKNSAEGDPIVKRYASWVAIAMLAKFMMLGVDKHGSFALADSDTDFFALAVAAVIESIQTVFTEQLFPELCELNGLPREVAPKYTHGDVEKVDVAAFTSSLNASLSSGAVTMDPGLEDHVRETLAYPPAKREENAAVDELEITDPDPGGTSPPGAPLSTRVDNAPTFGDK